MLKKLYAMITRKMEHKFEELKIYFNKKLSRTIINVHISPLNR